MSALFGTEGVVCRVFGEAIWDEYVAEDCEAFEPIYTQEAEIIGLRERRRK